MTAARQLSLTPLTLEQVIGELPAEARAELQWAPQKLRRALNRLLEGELTSALVAEVTSEVVGLQAFVLITFEALQGVDVWTLFAKETSRRARDIRRLPPVDARRALRALASSLAMAHLGIHQITSAELRAEIEQFLLQFDRLQVEFPEATAGLRSSVLLVALLHGLEIGANGERLSQLAKAADDEARMLAVQLAELAPPHQIKLPWYFEPPPGSARENVLSFATWAEPASSRNDVALELMKGWARADPAGQAESWGAVRTALDADRPSSRKLFP
ncbi:MAG: hypothetical protein JST92_05995 [Deltaproteobacteria bacterium]|nr:hypothetical protein [Deltaproteobacteria bacterium]